MEKYFEIGQIVNTHGLKGFIKINPFTDDITNFKKFKLIYVNIKGKLEKYDVEEIKFSKNCVLMKLKNINSIEQAEKLKGFFIKVDRSIYDDLEENTYYIADLIDCEVYTESNEFLGKINEVFSTKSNDVYIVKDNSGKQILLPAISEVVKSVDVENKKIIVHLLKGLI